MPLSFIYPLPSMFPVCATSYLGVVAVSCIDSEAELFSECIDVFCEEATESITAPQDGQNLAVSEIAAPHCEQNLFIFIPP